MATYVNDLRLKEIATGDESGTWGTSTNTNLELIGEAFSFGTEGITTNADTHTTTIADGSTDPGRSLYLKYTGTLDSACTITIGPNTVSKLWFIENGTSGSQNIIISQGSGANVTVPAGEVKAIYSDGAGSGAAMVDAFANLKVSDAAQTNITSLGTLTTLTVDDITINGSTISDSGDLTLDVAGNLILDADGGEFQFHDGGTNILEIANSSSDVIIRPAVQDKDLKFNGNDGGAAITALTLDMSAAGAATFNAGITASNAGIIKASRSDNARNILVFNDNSNATIESDTDPLLVKSANDITLDAANDIVLDADGSTISMKDGGTTRITFNLDATPDLVMAGGNASITTSTSNADFTIIGNDGGSDINALTFDMSDAGAATFNSSITVANTISISSSNTSAFIQASDNVFQFGTSSDDPMLFFANNAERARIDTAGNLLIGTTSFNTGAFGSAGGINISDTQPIMLLHESDTDKDGYIGIATSAMFIHTADAIPMRFSTNDAERMRIGATGEFMHNTTTASTSFTIQGNSTSDVLTVRSGSTADVNVGVAVFRDGAAEFCGQITCNGNANTVSYNTSSDARLKNVLGEAKGLEVINQLNPVHFEWKNSGIIQDGLIAQEVESIVPNAVTHNKESDVYSMDYSKLVTPLIKAIQEQQTQIDDLQSEIKTLKGE